MKIKRERRWEEKISMSISSNFKAMLYKDEVAYNVNMVQNNIWQY